MASPVPDSSKQHVHSLRTQVPSTGLRRFADLISFKSCNNLTRYGCRPTFTMRKLKFKMVKLCAWAHTSMLQACAFSLENVWPPHSLAVQPLYHATSHNAHEWERWTTQPSTPSSFYWLIYPFTFVCLYLSYIYESTFD